MHLGTHFHKGDVKSSQHSPLPNPFLTTYGTEFPGDRCSSLTGLGPRPRAKCKAAPSQSSDNEEEFPFPSLSPLDPFQVSSTFQILHVMFQEGPLLSWIMKFYINSCFPSLSSSF